MKIIAHHIDMATEDMLVQVDASRTSIRVPFSVRYRQSVGRDSIADFIMAEVAERKRNQILPDRRHEARNFKGKP